MLYTKRRSIKKIVLSLESNARIDEVGVLKFCCKIVALGCILWIHLSGQDGFSLLLSV